MAKKAKKAKKPETQDQDMLEFQQHVARFLLKGTSAYSQSRYHGIPKKSKEKEEAYETRTWKEHCHTTPDGNIFIPPSQFKKALEGAASYLGDKISGKGGMKTYGKSFLQGVIIVQGIILPITPDDITSERLFLSSTGQKNSGKRVHRQYPRIDQWEGELEVFVTDPFISNIVLERHMKAAGLFIGIGRFRPAVGGHYGRFDADLLSWEEMK